MITSKKKQRTNTMLAKNIRWAYLLLVNGLDSWSRD